MVFDTTMIPTSSPLKIFSEIEDLLDYLELNPHKKGIICFTKKKCHELSSSS